jgi:hypothetical protein
MNANAVGVANGGVAKVQCRSELVLKCIEGVAHSAVSATVKVRVVKSVKRSLTHPPCQFTVNNTGHCQTFSPLQHPGLFRKIRKICNIGRSQQSSSVETSSGVIRNRNDGMATYKGGYVPIGPWTG